jgi:hypothetical protein
MSEINLDYLQKTMPKFKVWLETDEGKRFVAERAIKDSFFSTKFSSGNIDNIDEGILRELARILWSYGGWNNKDYIADQMLKSGLPRIREAFKNLFYSDKPLAERYDQMRGMWMMGAATISEILAHFDPCAYPIYNRRAKSSLIKLGVKGDLLPKSATISGSQYESYAKVVMSVFDKVQKIFPHISDLLKLDFLLYYISTVIEEKAEKVLTESGLNERFDHDTAIDQILQLGDSLGFDIQKEYSVTSGCRIDAIWKSKVANLGTITYAFEVHNKGSRDSAILNLQRIFNADPTVQKAVIVATDEELAKFKGEIVSLSEDFRNSVGYFSVKSLEEALIHQEALKRILALIGLMKTRTKAET